MRATKLYALIVSIIILLGITSSSPALEGKAMEANQFDRLMRTALSIWYSHNNAFEKISSTVKDGKVVVELAGTGTIEGFVKDADGNPLQANVFCWSFNSSGPKTSSTITDDSGFYQITDLADGDYYLVASSNGYMPQFYDHTSNPLNAKPVSVTGADTISGIDFSLAKVVQGNSSISGTVTNEADSQPISGAWVIAFGRGNPFLFYKFFDITDESGNYELTGLPAGTYYLFVQAKSFLPEFYDNAYSPLQATPITVSDNSSITGIDFQLSKGGSISGVVHDADGNGIQGVKVIASAFNFQFNNQMMFLSPLLQFAITNENGEYKIEGLKEGQYRVSAILKAGSMPLVLFYNNATDYENATPVQVELGQETTGIDFEFEYQEPTGMISGKVTDSESNPLSGIRIIAWSQSDSVFSNFIGLWNTTETDANGEYVLDRLWPGKYYVGAVIWNWMTLRTVWYDGVNDFRDATPVPVENDQPVSNINFSIQIDNNYGSISGKVVSDEDGSPISYAYVQATPVEGHYSGSFIRPLPIMMAFTNSQGEYKINLLYEGKYIVSVRKNGYLEYYDDVADKNEATQVQVVGGQETTGIDFSIPPFPDTGSRISGMVSDEASGQPIPGALISVFPTIDNNHIGPGPGQWWALHFYTTFSDENGQYIVGGIPQGAYVVTCWARDYIAEFYDNRHDPWSADRIELDGTESREGIDFALTPGWGFNFELPTAGRDLGTISGSVKSDDGYKLEGVYVYAINKDNQIISSEMTGSDGAYALGGIEQGEYYIMASRMPFNTEYFNNASDLPSATAVEVGEADQWDVKNVDFSLSPIEATSVDSKETQPNSYVLTQNYPNPFNPSTVIEYFLPTSGSVKLEIYNLQGQLIKSLVDEYQNASWHRALWDGKDSQNHKLPSGIYLYRLQTGNFYQTKRLVLMK